MKKEIGLIIPLLFAFFIIFTPFSASATTTTITIGDLCSETGAVTASIMINDVADVAAATIKVSYNPSVIVVTDAGGSDFESFTPNLVYAEDGWVKIATFHYTSLSGNVKFAELTIEPRGSTGQSSKLDIDLVTLADSNYADIDATVIDGFFGIGTCDGLDGCYAYGNGCEDRDYYCSGSSCIYSYSNRHTDCHDDWDYYCSGDTVRKRKLFHDFYCEGGSCTDHTSWVDDQLAENCNIYDSWVDTGDTIWIDDPENECKEKKQKKQEYRDYTCSAGSCEYSVIATNWVDTGEVRNKPDGTDCGSDYYDDWGDYCYGNLVIKCRLFHDFYCAGGSCTDHPSWDCQLVVNCNDYDGWLNTSDTRWIDDPWNECKEKEQRKQEYRDYYCSAGNCEYSVTYTRWIDTGIERNKDDGTDCGDDYYDGFVSYCKGDEVWEHRLYHDFYCEGGTCTNHTSWQNDTFIENCSVSDGWYDTGNTSWINDPDNECTEKEQKEQEYRDYSCSGGSCDYSVTGTKWEDTGEVRNKPDGTVCGCTANNTLKKCYAGICSDTGICNSTYCGADSACDGENPGDTCDADKNCNSTCKCVTPPDTNPPVVVDVSVSPRIIPEDTDGDPRWGEVATMNVTLNDESNITSVTIDLSAIGKPANKPMTKNPGMDVWSVTTNASIGTAGWNGTAYVPYQMRVNATDEHGNSNTNISLNLTVMKNGDVSGGGDVDVWDCTYLARHIVGIEGYEKMSDEVADVSGDGDVDVWDCAYLAKYLVELPGYELLR